ncbi:MAG: efflux RND transporter permease subunit [Leptospiraceae bacterium]|nr:efflux RND transporter permease subunit [Leptospiraceae bacterium]
MQALVDYFLKRPTLVNVIIIAVFFLGLQSVLKMRKEAFPTITVNKVIITTIYPGASARDVELNVTREIEESIEGLSGVDEITSYSNEGYSNIVVSIDEDADEVGINKVFDDLDREISKISTLPSGIEGRPSLKKITSFDLPVLEIALFGKTPELRKFVDYFKAKLLEVEGVASVEIVGFPDEEIEVLVDPLKARNKLVDLRRIAYAIQKRNLEGSGGVLESFLSEKKVVSFSKFQSLDEILDTNVRMSEDGLGTKLRDIATLNLNNKEQKLRVRNNGKPGLSIKNKKDKDVLRTIDGIQSMLKKIEIPKGLSYSLFNDQSRFTRGRLQLVTGNAIAGFILVFIILFFTFDMKTSFWTAFGIPFSLFGVYIILYNMGITLNALTLGGFIVVIGMLVDDAIVVAEEISTYKEEGMSSFEAAKKAVEHVWKPVLASSTTTMIAFSPLVSLGGLPGKFVWVLPLIVILALSVSLFDAYFLLPSHLSHGKVKKIEKKKFVHSLENFYQSVLLKILKFRYVILVLFILLFISSLYLAKEKIRKDPFPQDSSEGITVQFTFPHGYSMDKVEKELTKFEEVLISSPKEDVAGFSLRFGTHSLDPTTDRGSLDNIATAFIYLTPFNERKRQAFQIIKQMREDIRRIYPEGRVTFLMDLMRIGPPMGKDFEIRVSSEYEKEREETVKKIIEYLSKKEGLLEIKDDKVIGKDEINLKFKHDLLSRAGLTVEDVLSTLRIAFDGMIVSSMNHENKTKDIRLRLNEKARADEAFISKLPLLNNRDYMIPLQEFVWMEEKPSRGEIVHVNRIQTTTIFGSVDIRKVNISKVLLEVAKEFPSSGKVRISFSGQPVESQKIFSNLGSAAMIAILGIYLVISLIFDSFAKPFLIMLAIPFSIIGVMYSLYLHNMPISIFAGLAIVGLSGVVVNDSIVMVYTIFSKDEINNLNRDTIVEGAVSRLRPILLTTITTVLGLLPTAYGIGGSDPFFEQMCIALAYGLLFGTFIVLVLIPIFTSILIDFLKWRRKEEVD